jgi:hypothetical protein
LARVTTDHLERTLGALARLARDRDTEPDYYLIAHLVDQLAWLQSEIADAERAAALGPGISEVHVLGSGSAGVDARLHDLYLKELRRLRKPWRHQLATLSGGLACTACGVRYTQGWERDIDAVAERASRDDYVGT